MTSRSRRIISCPRCNRTMVHGARGLCSSCYWWHWKTGTLDRYPTQPVKSAYWKATVDPDAIDEAVVDRILGGEWRMKANPSEKAEVCRHWVRSGRPLRQLASLTGWATHRYYRLRDAA